jgi:hypothetical protein
VAISNHCGPAVFLPEAKLKHCPFPALHLSLLRVPAIFHSCDLCVYAEDYHHDLAALADSRSWMTHNFVRFSLLPVVATLRHYPPDAYVVRH